ncbi:MAG TPA: phosphotransferase [Geminicoccus sp.]|jgi:thiamine kinase-like enzyme|uniref:phosphotransferase n=1 Tax=Geminicoccus sp. TaxID=2024832 RepID=UPI002E3450B6|nr:phosphotransferase [Geminicoccus sp.]HEX2526459.1 phosphotransferase [Geminicoccus sp.]
MTLDEAARKVASLSIWQGKVEPKPLGGGITNLNFIVDDGPARRVVRVGEDILYHGILRRNELAASKAAAAAGLSPAVIHAEPGILVLDYVEAEPLDPDAVRLPRNRQRLVHLLRQCHRDVARHLRGPGFMFWVFHVLRDYGHVLREGKSRHLDRLDRLLQAGERLEKIVGPVEIVFGHNDLLPANILDDGQRLWLVDWEYAGFNSPLFDLGGLASNAGMPQPESEALLEAYYEQPLSDDLRRTAAAMAAASLLRETMWSMVSEIHSTLDFDYAAYTSDNLARFEAALGALDAMERS